MIRRLERGTCGRCAARSPGLAHPIESTGEGISAQGNVFDLHRDDIDTRQSVAANFVGRVNPTLLDPKQTVGRSKGAGRRQN